MSNFFHYKRKGFPILIPTLPPSRIKQSFASCSLGFTGIVTVGTFFLHTQLSPLSICVFNEHLFIYLGKSSQYH